MWNQLKTILLFGILSALLIGIGGTLAPDSLMVFVAIALVMNVGAYFFSDKIVLATYRAREVSEEEAPELYEIVGELARAAKIPQPRVFVIPEAQPNAFATGRNPQHAVVAVTEGLMTMLDRREIRGVLAHEIGHVKNRDILISTVAAVIASAITTIAQVLSFGAMFGGRSEDRNPLTGLVGIIVGPIAATLIQLAISRSRELEADETGAKLAADPDGLISALLKLDQAAKRIAPEHASPGTANLFIVNPFGAREFSRYLSTHPPIEERIERLRELAAGSMQPRYAG
ncbi:MAG: protease [Myxococcales bacterium]|nr:protease [Myxococcales bacterium]